MVFLIKTAVWRVHEEGERGLQKTSRELMKESTQRKKFINSPKFSGHKVAELRLLQVTPTPAPPSNVKGTFKIQLKTRTVREEIPPLFWNQIRSE